MPTIHPFSAIIPKIKQIESPKDFFGVAKEKFPNYLAGGCYETDLPKSLFIYECEKWEQKHIGIIGLLNLSEYHNDNILRHENTLTAKEEKMMRLTFERNALIKPVLLTYKTVENFNDLIRQYADTHTSTYEVSYLEEIHRYWQVNDEAIIAKLQKAFSSIDKTYIADGHHRLASCNRIQDYMTKTKNHDTNAPYNSLLCVLLPDDQLNVHDFNRTVDIDISSKVLFEKLEKYATVKPLDAPQKPRKRGEVTMCYQNKWYRIKWSSKVLKKRTTTHELLDVSILNDIVLHKVLKIEDVRTNKAVKYVEGIVGIEGMEKKINGTNKIGFMLYPIEAHDLMDIADNKGIMPPKSTWFEPRIRNGMIAYDLGKIIQCTPLD